MQTTIKKKQLQFKDDKLIYHVQIVYDSSPFGYSEKSFWKIKLSKVNDERLVIPIEYQYTNRKAIQKYESQINNFKFLIELKYQPKFLLLQEQKRELKLKLKSNEIDNKVYQKLYTPIRIEKDRINFYIWDICYRFIGRYFEKGRLKEIYR